MLGVLADNTHNPFTLYYFALVANLFNGRTNFHFRLLPSSTTQKPKLLQWAPRGEPACYIRRTKTRLPPNGSLRGPHSGTGARPGSSIPLTPKI